MNTFHDVNCPRSADPSAICTCSDSKEYIRPSTYYQERIGDGCYHTLVPPSSDDLTLDDDGV